MGVLHIQIGDGQVAGVGDGVRRIDGARAYRHAVRQAFFGQVDAGAADGGQIVRAGNRNRQHGLALVAVGIGDGVADGLGQQFARLQPLDSLQAVVELIRPGAIAIVHQRAVLGVAGSDDRRDCIGAERVAAQQVAGDGGGRAFR